ncbi:hypothetical protein ASD62_00365 [Phycicoccus sp. Root563]|uniref:DUF1905 domain-containing protein n=1 Tax=Phycicoccus sp. Root563 TaxID=1736562 RepID=UPI000703537D|nr:DUF1905 domain-containing protein [Phycicoccus sp. Root563]KQZ88003.1 hypothetical protein ASD62_00365 [Phycicoccus sp. Root563]
MGEQVGFTGPLWEWGARDSWYFVTLDDEAAEVVRERPRPPRGFGSVRVRATVGSTTWTTSIFPSAGAGDEDGSYVLPVKRAVRAAEGIEEGDPVTVRLELLD